MNRKTVSLILILAIIFGGIITFNFSHPKSIETLSAFVISDSVSVQSQDSGKIKILPVTQSQKVEKGDVIVEIETSEPVTVSAKSNAKELESAQKEYENAAIMYKDGIISQEEYDNSLTKLKQVQEKSNTKKVVMTPKITKIYSPIDGVVVLNNIKEGDNVAKETILAKVNSSYKEINAYFPASNTNAIKSGNSVDIMIIKYPEKTFTGKIKEVLPVNAKGVPVKIIFDQDTSALDVQNGASAIVKIKQ